jgi:hypothetical protein
MIDAFIEPGPAQSFDQSELTLAAIKDYLLSKGGRVRYRDLFDHFREQIIDSSSG